MFAPTGLIAAFVDVQDIQDARTKDWGTEVSAVEIRDVQLTDNMVKAIAKQAEAERDRRAKVIHADAEFQAAQNLVNAATILASVPAAMQLRYLQTLTEIGGEHNTTVVFPMPLDIVKPFLARIRRMKTGKDILASIDFRNRSLWCCSTLVLSA
jgi:regulator of protease activity HflC (stomatin/prohibitin superfamily)